MSLVSNWVCSRWCNEAYYRWPVGSFGLCHVDTWFVCVWLYLLFFTP